MLEPLRCPSCSTRFGLTASRVRPGLRRAKCLRCDTIFGIEEVVARLLAPEPAPAPEPWAAPVAAPPVEPPPSLTLGDLEGAEDEIMEKTLVDIPAPAPETGFADFVFQDPAEAADQAEAGMGSNYTSARDAIQKLMGAAPTVPHPPRAIGSRGNTMDVEATLSALDSTLGGSHDRVPEVPPTVPDHASTMKLTATEIQAALAARAPEPPSPSAKTEALPRPEFPPAPVPGAPVQDASVLKVQLEQETCNNVSLEQMTAWIEQGKVHEYHMVARQFSDNWIEASKVPSLRPVFERRRKYQLPAPEAMPIPPADVLPPKKGLFGGFFGRN